MRFFRRAERVIRTDPDRSMKLLYLSGSYVPSRSASSVHVMKMCAALARTDAAVELVTKGCASRQESGVEDDFAFYGVEPAFELTKLPRPAHRGGGLVFAREVRRKLRRTEPGTLVYARDLVGAWLASRAGLAVAYEAHGLPIGALSRRLLRDVLRSGRLVRLVVISRALGELLVESMPDLSRAETLVAHDAADPLPTGPATATSSNDLRVGYVGHLYPGRGVDIVLEIASRHPGLEVHLVGGWPADVERWRASDLPRNTTLHGFVPPAALPEIYAGLDILLMPYQRKVGVRSGRSDTSAWMSPMKMFEYMAAGKAIVSSDLPVLREVLEHERSALMVSPDAPEEWVDAVRRLRQDRDLRDRLGCQARRDFEERHTWSARAEKVLDGLG